MDEENFEQNEQNENADEKKEIGDYLFDWKRKFDNFWYHYKVAFIIGVLIFAFVIFCIAQCAARVKGDVNIGYIGPMEIDGEAYEDLQSALNELLGEDINGDGKIYADFTQFLYMTSYQIETVRAKGQLVDMQSLLTVQTQINLELAGANIIIYFIDLEVYKELSGRTSAFMPIEDILGYLPEDSYDIYALKLGTLQCWDYYTGLHNFPSNTVMVVREMLLSEEDNADIKERYEAHLKMFRRMVDFKFKSENPDDDPAD